MNLYYFQGWWNNKSNIWESIMSHFETAIKKVLEHQGPILCEIETPEHQLLIPRVQSKKDKDEEKQ